MPEASAPHRRIRSRHAPAGRVVPPEAVRNYGPVQGGARALDLWAETAVLLLDSGTSALAVALKQCLNSMPAQSVKRVALPAYACPNLVAAALWAGATPVYYDLTRNLSPDPASFTKWLAAEDTVVVHVDAFGARSLPSDVASDLTVATHPRLVRDLAQSFAPYAPGWSPESRFTVLSTGRAKPMSLTTGGALLSRGSWPAAIEASEAGVSRGKFSLRATVYGTSLRPAVFGLLSSIPQLKIGSTEFSALDEVRTMPAGWQGAFAAGVAAARRDFEAARAATDSMLALAREAGATLPDIVSADANRLPLWRVPVLCPTPEAAVAVAEEAGHLGVSRLYGRALPVILGQAREAAAAEWPGAVWISERLITLPTHGRLSAAERAELKAILQARCPADRELDRARPAPRSATVDG